MTSRRRTFLPLAAALVALASTGTAVFAVPKARPEVSGTLWVANRSTHTVRAFDAATGVPVMTVEMRHGSQSPDLAYAKGKLYVSEEFGAPPAIAVVDATTGGLVGRIPTGPRSHHIHASRGGNLVSYGVFGTNRVGVIDASSGTLLGEWPATQSADGRAHAGVFGPDGRTLYVASDNVNELTALDPRSGQVLWRMQLPAPHELAVTSDERTAYVSSRSTNRLFVVGLAQRPLHVRGLRRAWRGHCRHRARGRQRGGAGHELSRTAARRRLRAQIASRPRPAAVSRRSSP